MTNGADALKNFGDNDGPKDKDLLGLLIALGIAAAFGSVAIISAHGVVNNAIFEPNESLTSREQATVFDSSITSSQKLQPQIQARIQNTTVIPDLEQFEPTIYESQITTSLGSELGAQVNATSTMQHAVIEETEKSPLTSILAINYTIPAQFPVSNFTIISENDDEPIETPPSASSTYGGSSSNNNKDRTNDDDQGSTNNPPAEVDQDPTSSEDNSEPDPDSTSDEEEATGDDEYEPPPPRDDQEPGSGGASDDEDTPANTSVLMSGSTTSGGLSLYYGRPFHAELITSESVLVGEEIDSITLMLRKVGDPTGTADVGVFDQDRDLIEEFGTISVSSLTGTYEEYAFYLGKNLPGHILKSGDLIGIRYSGGDPDNVASVMRDTDPSGPFDGSNSYHVYYVEGEGWKNHDDHDLYMKLTNTRSETSTLDPEGSTGGSADDSSNRKPVLIHFDDGTASQWSSGKPILDKYDIKATFYVVCGKVGDDPYMTWSQLETLEKEGHSIQDHTMSHPHLPDLSNSELEYEISECKNILSEKLGIKASHIAIPYNDGENDPRVVGAISNYYEFAKGDNTADIWELDCGNSCETSVNGQFNPDSRYAIAQFSHDYYLDANGEIKTYAKFESLVNSGKVDDSSGNVLAVPIITYHRIGGSDGVPLDMFEKEMKYLHDNDFWILTMDDLSYDSREGQFFIDD